MRALIRVTSWERVSLWRRILGAFIRVGILIVFLTVLFTLLGPPFGILLTKTMEARRVPAVKVAPRELADYSISNSSGTTLAYFGYKFDVPWKANFKQKAVGKNLVEVQFELGQDLVFIVPENQRGLLTEIVEDHSWTHYWIER